MRFGLFTSSCCTRKKLVSNEINTTQFDISQIFQLKFTFNRKNSFNYIFKFTKKFNNKNHCLKTSLYT